MSILSSTGKAARIALGVSLESAGRLTWITAEGLQKAADLSHSLGAASLAKADECYDSAGLDRRPWELVRKKLYLKLATEFDTTAETQGVSPEPKPAVG